MGKKARIMAAAACAVLVATLLWACFQPGEPIYDGHPVSYWVHNFRTYYQFTDTDNGTSATFVPPPNGATRLPRPAMDSNAVPFLIKALAKQNQTFYSVRVWIWRKMPRTLRNRMPEPLPPELVRASALDLLQHVGPSAKAAIPAVIKMVEPGENRELRIFAIDCLVQIDRNDPAVIEALSKASKDTNSSVRTEAILQLQGADNMQRLLF